MKADHSTKGARARGRVIAALVAASPASSAGARAQERPDPMAATVGQWFAMIERSFVSLAEAMPAAKYGFKPTDGEFKDVEKYRPIVTYVAALNLTFGLMLIAIDLHAGMPVWWTAAEGPSIVVFGAVLAALNRPARRCQTFRA